MKKEDLIALCHYYHGEDEDKCPFCDTIKARLWAAEMMTCTYFIQSINKDNPKDDLHNMVFAYVSKWDPYTFRDTLDEYIKVAKPKQEIINTYYD